MIAVFDTMLAAAFRRFGVDPYLNRAGQNEPRFLYLREPGSAEVNVFGWKAISPGTRTCLGRPRDGGKPVEDRQMSGGVATTAAPSASSHPAPGSSPAASKGRG